MADLILAGVDVITLDPQRPVASAVAITGGRITAVGDRHDVRHWRGPGAEDRTSTRLNSSHRR